MADQVFDVHALFRESIPCHPAQGSFRKSLMRMDGPLENQLVNWDPLQSLSSVKASSFSWSFGPLYSFHPAFGDESKGYSSSRILGDLGVHHQLSQNSLSEPDIPFCCVSHI